MSSTAEPRARYRVWPLIAIAIILFVFAALVLVSPSWGKTISLEAGQQNVADVPPVQGDPELAPEGCEPEFVQVVIDRSDGNIEVDPRFEPNVNAIRANNSLDKEAKVKAIAELDLQLTGSNAQTLAAWANGMPDENGEPLYDNPNDWPELVEGGEIVENGCLSDKGKLLWWEFRQANSQPGTTMAIGPVPEHYTNSANHDGVIVVSDEPGITGDRDGVIITYPDGSQFIRLIRCANVVYPSAPPNLPPGKTDNPPPTTPPTTPPPPVTPPPTTPPPTTPPPTIWKDSPTADPYPQGNAPVGGGTNADPGPGTYIPPTEMPQPPETPYTPPPPPPPAPPEPPAPPAPSDDGSPSAPPAPPPTVPTPDPEPAPEPEPEAPPPSAPESSCLVIPDVEDCSG